MKPKKQAQAPAKKHPADAIEHPFVHRCEHPGCRAWGSFGFAVALRHGQRGRWFCAEHKADGERVAAEQPTPVPAWRGDKQGKLL